MLLGIGYHASFAYVPDIAQWYLVEDVSTDAVFATIGHVLHAGRMQVFFVLSGYFAHLVAQRGTFSAFAVDRTRRLLGPFLVFVPLVVGFDFAAQAWAQQHGLLDATYRARSDSSFRPLYLWFLEYALIFSFAFWPLKGLKPTRVVPEALLALSVVTAGAQMVLGEATPAFSYLPQVASLLHFGPFFAVGWWLLGSREPLTVFERSWWLGPAGLLLAAWVTSRPIQWQPAGVALLSVSSWAMVIGALSVAVRMKSAPSAGVRWLVESSYWVYLSHYPVVVSMQLLLAREPWPAWAKFGVVIAVTSAVSLGSYALLIRPTRVGRWLGRTAPNSLVRCEPPL